MGKWLRLNTIDRRKGFVAGLIGGAVGVLVMQAYWRILPQDAFDWLPHSREPVEAARKLPAIEPLLGRRYLPDEAAAVAVGRTVYRLITGRQPRSLEERDRLRWLVLWAWGLGSGVAYGATRTTTRPRDLAGGFFYGLRLWFGDTVLTGLLGLKPDPRQWPLREHLLWLTTHWVYTFVTTQVTRLLYRAL